MSSPPSPACSGLRVPGTSIVMVASLAGAGGVTLLGLSPPTPLPFPVPPPLSFLPGAGEPAGTPLLPPSTASTTSDITAFALDDGVSPGATAAGHEPGDSAALESTASTPSPPAFMPGADDDRGGFPRLAARESAIRVRAGAAVAM
ncbi:unnamed protein product, partial [Ectocarpus sp. 12 AP-2014]